MVDRLIMRKRIQQNIRISLRRLIRIVMRKMSTKTMRKDMLTNMRMMMRVDNGRFKMQFNLNDFIER